MESRLVEHPIHRKVVMPMDTQPLTEALADQFVGGWLAHLRTAGYTDRTIERAAR